jgi:hypothetical protein
VSAQGVRAFPHVAVVWVGFDGTYGDADYCAWVDQVILHCTAPEWAPCRTYPDCGCEAFDCTHEAVSGRPCWIAAWFADPDYADYIGSDTEDGSHPPAARVGLIDADWDYDHLEWRWA